LAEAAKPLLFAAIVALGLAAVYTSALIVQRQHALMLVARYNVTWDASQAFAELLRLETAVAAYAVPDGGGSKAQIQLRLEIVSNRVGLLTTGQVDAVLEREPDLRNAVDQLRQATEKTHALAANIDTPGRVREILALLTPLNARVARLAAVANVLGADRVADDQRQLSRVHWIFSGMLGGLFFCAIGLVALLLRQNDLLGRAQQNLRTLASDLEIKGTELIAANKAVSDANTELQLQNLTLQERDLELRVQNERFDAALNNMSQGLCMVDADERVIVCNRRFAELFRLSSEAIAPGDAIAEIVGAASEANQRDEALFKAVAAHQQLLGRQRRADDFFYEGNDGRALAILQRPMLDGGWLATYEDITERRRVEARVRHMAHHDMLTNLPNRVLFRERLDDALRAMKDTDDGVAVLMLDLDFFKDVNDTLGHPAGDMLLGIVGQRLRNCVAGQDMVARLGGDEFAVLQISVAHRGQCATLAERIVEVLQASYDLDGQRVTVTASIGIAVAPADGANSDLLIKRADMALYGAKARERATHRFFDPEMEADVHERRLLGLELREALSNGDFEVFYQPIVSLRDGCPSGFEALIRWRHRERGLVLPDRFIPLAEEMGVIGALGEWILTEACIDCMTWPENLRVSVNLSPRQFSSPLVQTFRRALDTTGLSPARLDVEITESVLLQENEANLKALFDLRALGIGIALDDFGTGYSSLSYLRRFPFDKIKVDRSFVQGMADDPGALAIVQSITDLAPKLGMRTIAEGIETVQELEQVTRAGCAEGQGYYFGRPMKKSDIADYLSSGASESSVRAEDHRRHVHHNAVRRGVPRQLSRNVSV
jgi:diguanylate cyclase (GGDEF)-like protein